MSTLKATYLQHPSASSANVTLASDGKATFNGAMVGAGLDLITSSTFSSVSTVSINNCFNSTYDNYRIVLDHNASASIGITARLRLNGTDDSSANYTWQRIMAAATSLSTARSTGTTAYFFGDSEIASPNIASVDMFKPNKAVYTGYVGNLTASNSGSYLVTAYGNHQVATAYDGITLIASSGTITGTVRVYGYRNS